MDLRLDASGATGTLDDLPPLPAFLITLSTASGGAYVRVRLHGELDLATAPDVAAGLVPLTAPRGDGGTAVRGTVSLDLADLAFLDTAGLTALRRARSALRASGWHVRLTAPQPAVRRLVEHAVREGWFPTGTLVPSARRSPEVPDPGTRPGSC